MNFEIQLKNFYVCLRPLKIGSEDVEWSDKNSILILNHSFLILETIENTFYKLEYTNHFPYLFFSKYPQEPLKGQIWYNVPCQNSNYNLSSFIKIMAIAMNNMVYSFFFGIVCHSATISVASYFGATIEHISPPLDFFINVPHLPKIDLSSYKINDLEGDYKFDFNTLIKFVLFTGYKLLNYQKKLIFTYESFKNLNPSIQLPIQDDNCIGDSLSDSLLEIQQNF